MNAVNTILNNINQLQQNNSDAKYFQKGKVEELRQELLEADAKRDPRHYKRRVTLKKIVANMTMGNDMSPLFPDVIACMQLSDLEIKKMVYLYLINYARKKSDLVLMAINSFLKDASDPNPLIRGLAIRTMSYINVDKVIDCLGDPLRACLKDTDPYVRKTAATSVAKLYFNDRQAAMKEGLLDSLKDLLKDGNPTVISNALASLIEIHEKSTDFNLTIEMSTASNLASALNECSEWAQVNIMEGLMFVIPKEPGDAEGLIDRIISRLQHANSALVLSSMKVILYLLSFIRDSEYVDGIYRKIAPTLVTLMNSPPEIQYVALRNILLVMQKRPRILENEMKVFFCKYNDPIYVKLSKLEVMFRLVNEKNAEIMLNELKEYATEVDIDFVRKSVRSIGRCAIKIDSSADKCIEALVELVQTKVNYVVQEAVVVIKDIFRKYPNKYESVISVLCENLDTLDEPEAKASMIWIVGQYADRIENAADLLEGFIESFIEDPAEVQLASLTAVIKLFIRRPNEGKELVPKILKWATEETENPDVRDRGYIYWRLLSADPVTAKAIVTVHQPPINTESDNLDPQLLNELLLNIGSLVSIHQKPLKTLYPTIRSRNAANISGRAVTSMPQFSNTSYSNNNSFAPPPATTNYNPYSMDAAPSKPPKVAIQNLLDLGDDMPSSPQVQRPAAYAPFEEIPKQASQPAQNNTPVDLVSQLSTLSIGADLSAHVQYIAPKQVYLNANAAKGLEIQGTFARRRGNAYLDLTVSNKALQPMTDFAIQFNKNTFGLLPAGPVQIRSPLPPNQSADTSLQLSVSPLTHAQPTLPVNQIHVAVKNNVSVFFFYASVPLYVLLREEGQLPQNEFLKLWKDVKDGVTAAVMDGFAFPNVDALRARLSANNIFTVAERQIDDKYCLYLSAKLADGTPFLMELQAVTPPSGPIVSGNVTAKSPVSGLVPELLQSLTAILRH